MNEIRKYSRAALAAVALLAPLPASASASDDSLEAPPTISSYADIDRALEETWLLPPGTPWRYFTGKTAPGVTKETMEAAAAKSDEDAATEADTQTRAERREAMRKALEEAVAWSKEGFDDSDWPEGPSPFRYGTEGPGTVLEAFGEDVTTVYLRCALDVPDPGRYERIVVEIPADDGFLFYFNGSETKRRGAGDPLVLPGPAFTSSSKRDLTTRPVPTADLTRTIEDGFNQLAIHAFVHEEDRETFGVAPVVRATFRRTPELDRERFDLVSGVVAAAPEADRERLSVYLDARHAQRTGDVDAAASGYARLTELDPSSPLAWQRRLECHRALGNLAALDTECRERMAAEPTFAMLDTWTRLNLEELGRTPAEVAAALPAWPACSRAAAAWWPPEPRASPGSTRWAWDRWPDRSWRRPWCCPSASRCPDSATPSSSAAPSASAWTRPSAARRWPWPSPS